MNANVNLARQLVRFYTCTQPPYTTPIWFFVSPFTLVIAPLMGGLALLARHPIDVGRRFAQFTALSCVNVLAGIWVLLCVRFAPRSSFVRGFTPPIAALARAAPHSMLAWRQHTLVHSLTLFPFPSLSPRIAPDHLAPQISPRGSS